MNTKTMFPKIRFPRKLFKAIFTCELFWDSAYVLDVTFEISFSSHTCVEAPAVVRTINWIGWVGNLKQIKTITLIRDVFMFLAIGLMITFIGVHVTYIETWPTIAILSI